ncbi:MAG: hypothetical protein AB2712_15485 [Candidatus Thiodiazotropha sp.]
MFTLLKIILLGGSTIITPNPIDIGQEPILIKFEEPISAITSGASINIDITPYISSVNISDGLKEIVNIFPSGCVVANLNSRKGEVVTLSRSTGSWNGEQKMLNLSSEIGVPTGVKYISMQLSSCKEIKNAVVTWYNYSV